MNDLKKFLYGLHPLLLSTITSALTIAQIILAFIVKGMSSEAVQWIGWICVWSSAIFGILPIFTFRKKGGVAKGKSFMKTTVLVDTGIYAIVRHPQGGTAWLLINLGVMLITFHWLIITLGLVSMILVYADTFKSDQYCVEKFGDSYKSYIQRVPRVNFLLGIFWLLTNKRGG